MAPGHGAAGKPGTAMLAASAARAALAIAEPTLVRSGVAHRTLWGEKSPATPPVRPVEPRGEARRGRRDLCPADLLVVGSSRRGMPPGPVAGQVSRYRVAHARCPVLAVPPRENWAGVEIRAAVRAVKVHQVAGASHDACAGCVWASWLGRQLGLGRRAGFGRLPGLVDAPGLGGFAGLGAAPGLAGFGGLGDSLGLAGCGLGGAVGTTVLRWPGWPSPGGGLGWPARCAGGARMTRWARFCIGPGSAPA